MDNNKAIEILGQAATGEKTAVDDDLRQAAEVGQKALLALVALQKALGLIAPFIITEEV